MVSTNQSSSLDFWASSYLVSSADLFARATSTHGHRLHSNQASRSPLWVAHRGLIASLTQRRAALSQLAGSGGECDVNEIHEVGRVHACLDDTPWGVGDTERSATKNWFLKETYKEVWKADEEF